MTEKDFERLEYGDKVVITKIKDTICLFRQYYIGQELIYYGKNCLYDMELNQEYYYDFIVGKTNLGYPIIASFRKNIYKYINTKSKYRLMKLKQII